VVRELDGRHYRIVGSAVLLASGRPLPSLAKILGSHPLIHTAEGEFFRHAVRKACEGLKISVTAIRERELEERFTQEQVNMLRHHNVSVNAQLETTPHVLQAVNKKVEHLRCFEMRLTPVATERYKMGLSGFLKAPKTAGHETNLHRAGTGVKCCPG
jgi:hypothetical protein